MEYCEEWKTNKNINPKTKRWIDTNGPTYRMYHRFCENNFGDDCKKWKQNKNVNPETGNSIKTGGPVYKKFEKMCIGTDPKEKEEVDNCEKWKQNKGVNPETGRKIKIGGPTYKKLETKCREQTKKNRPGVFTEDIFDRKKKPPSPPPPRWRTAGINREQSPPPPPPPRTNRAINVKKFLKVLGLNIEDLDETTLKRRYKRLALDNHPDKFTNNSSQTIREQSEKFKEINLAYNTLLKFV